VVLDGAVVRSIQLGRELRSLRVSARMSIEEAAKALYFSPSRLSRIELGQQSIDVHAVRSALDLYGDASKWSELVELCLQTQEKGWWRAYGLDDKCYVPLEAEATRVREVTLAFVPGLLQTADYARALFWANPEPRRKAWVDNEVEVRMIRQQRLTSTDKPLELVALFDESALLRPIGGVDVIRAQLARLIEAAECPTVSLHVLPMSVGVRPACQQASPCSASITSTCRTSCMSSVGWEPVTSRRGTCSRRLKLRSIGFWRSP
jgi:transcriptional regulator with XRE-family HTH domain